jgi:hypothetical protein
MLWPPMETLSLTMTPEAVPCVQTEPVRWHEAVEQTCPYRIEKSEPKSTAEKDWVMLYRGTDPHVSLLQAEEASHRSEELACALETGRNANIWSSPSVQNDIIRQWRCADMYRSLEGFECENVLRARESAAYEVFPSLEVIRGFTKARGKLTSRPGSW